MTQNDTELLEDKLIDLSPAPNGIQGVPANRRRLQVWAFVFGAMLGAVAAFFFLHAPKDPQSDTPRTGQGSRGKGKGKKGSGTVQVVAAEVRRGDLSVYITGLGAVTPIYTVVVKSRVDGELTKILFSEGQMARKGDLLVEIDPRPYQVQLAQAEAQLKRDQALAKNARLDLERYQKLITEDAIPQQQLATQDALLAQYEATVQGDQAAVESARLNLEYCHITSPITGLIGLRLVDPGNIVHAADTGGMLVITQMDPISVIFTTAEDQLQPVLKRWRAGQQLQVEAWDRDLKNRLSTGKLLTIDNQIDASTGTLRLRAVFDNKESVLFPSQFVNARMLVEKNKDVTLVPSSAIQRNGQDTYVWLLKPDQTVAVRDVTLFASEGDQSEIASGLKPGDVVVTIGVDRLQNGSRVATESSKGKSRKQRT